MACILSYFGPFQCPVFGVHYKPQVYDALAQAENSDVCVAVLHHPFEWLVEFDQHRVEESLGRKCHFILRGHQHLPQVNVVHGTSGNYVIIPAGASYDRPPLADLRYANAYNFVHYDPEAMTGTVYLQRWSDRQSGWIPDTDSWENGEFPFELSREPARKKSKRVKSSSARPALDEHLEHIVKLYLSTAFERDQYAKLDQAGETDPDRTTLLRQVFVDLEVKSRNERQPRGLRRQLALFEEREQVAEELRASGDDKPLSAMECFLQEMWPMIAIIGGPGQGKSTLSQFLAQVQRATLLGCKERLNRHPSGSEAQEREFVPKTPRVPFRIVLKYFAQWLSDKPRVDSVEAYLAEQVEKEASRQVSPESIQEILCNRPSLVIFDGLDEVIEPDLRSRLLARIVEFLGRAEQLDADLQVIATSRPTGYSDQFDPQRFWHLELQPMSEAKVQEYARRWVEAKVPVDEERQRVLDTLKECQQEEHTKLLLATPLQVTIVLLITKDGGRPPAQREALFHEYWNTIFRREKAKAKGVIRTEESVLFELHSYLGYLLQCRSAVENVRSLLPAAEFETAVHNFLREKDSRSPEEVIKQRASSMVKEARDRLVLLVEPEPGLFGFELRSLQEFFAAAYLTQTARDTTQRFERLKAIALPEHWRNVALFFAGRIVRNFGGEAANILELVCRPIDREPPDCYLRRGAWLALDIAADGAFAANRDLQYGAWEYALTVLDTGMTQDQQGHLDEALGRLSPEDQRDILMPILDRKLAILPASCLAQGLNAYARIAGANQAFVQKIEELIGSGNPEYLRKALELGFRYQVEPKWLAMQLDHHWPTWSQKGGIFVLLEPWQSAPKYTEAVISIWSPSEDRVCYLLSDLTHRSRYFSGNRRQSSVGPINEPRSFADQMLAVLKCFSILSVLDQPRPAKRSELIEIGKAGAVTFIDLDRRQERRTQTIARLGLSGDQLDQLLARPDLIPHLRAGLWCLYWAMHEPTTAKVSAFMQEIVTWAKGDQVPQIFWRYGLGDTWPLLAYAVERQIKGDYDVANHLQTYLSKQRELSLNAQVLAAVQEFAQQASDEECARFIQELGIGEMRDLPGLASAAEEMGIDIGELGRLYLSGWSRREQHTNNSSEVKRVFRAIEKTLNEPQQAWRKFARGAEAKWVLDQETLTEGKLLLAKLMDIVPELPSAISTMIGLFLKLLSVDQQVMNSAPKLLTVVAGLNDVRREMIPWTVARVIVSVPLKRLVKLGEFIQHDDKIIQKGALNLWAILAESIVLGPRFLGDSRRWERIRSLRLAWQTVLRAELCGGARPD